MIYYYIKSFFAGIRKNKFFYFINLTGFLTGFLMFLVILTYVYQEISFDKFHKNADYIYRINSGGYGVTPLCFGDKLKNTIPEISDIIRFTAKKIKIVENENQTEQKKLFYADNNLFRVFSFELFEGNKENVLKEPYSIVISKSLSVKLFGKVSPIGKTIKSKEGITYHITGVMEDIPDNSHLYCDMFSSIETLRSIDSESFNCSQWGYLTYVMLYKNVNVKTAEEKINKVLEDSRMKTGDKPIKLKLENLKKIYFDYEGNKYDGCKHGNKQSVIIYIAISLTLLFLIIVNYINLFIAISSNKIKTIAVKKIMGASRIQIIKQFVFEAFAFSLLSFFITVAIIELSLPALMWVLDLHLNNSQNWGIIYSLFFGITLIIGAIIGIIPGISISKINAIKTLKKESFFKSKGIPRKLMLILQLTIVSVLLNSSFIINKQIKYILSKDLGFNYENVVYFRLDKELEKKHDVLKDMLSENPDIKEISFSSSIMGDGFGKSTFENNNHAELCYFLSIDPDYIDLYKINIKEGRSFSWEMSGDSENACLVNEKACKLFQLTDPINEVIGNRKIVGIVSDFNFVSLHKSIEPLIIYCNREELVVQLKIDNKNPGSTLDYINKVCHKLSPDNNIETSFLKDYLNDLYKGDYNLSKNFKVYSIATFIIALLGILALALFMIKKKKKEIAIRKLLGAKVKDTFLILAKEYFIIVLIANILAIPLTYNFMKKWIANFQYKISFGFSLFIGIFLIELIFTLLVILFIIIKSHRVNSAEILKEE